MDKERRKKILFQSDFSLIKSGFGRNAKTLLTYLYNTGKYDIVQYCVGVQENYQDLERTPWKSIGCLPSSEEKREIINNDPKLKSIANYGAFYLDEVIEKERPDVYFAVQDIWGVDFATEKSWFDKISSVIWTTLDSLPILPSAIRAAKKTKNYWVWSDFARKALNKEGCTHAKTVHGVLEHDEFFPLDKKRKKELRKENKIPQNSFVIGFVFRNQLRKSVSNLLRGYKLFKKNNKDIKNPRLLLHTDFGEGWDILRLADEIGISRNEILATHLCGACLKYRVKPHEGKDKDCEYCGVKASVNTAGIALGVSETQLNEVYNLMDVYAHPFTSGGQEIPIQEAKLTGLLTLVTNYSCGEEMCYQEAYSLPLDWEEYREFGTQFIKASTHPESIAEQLEKAYKMPEKERLEMGQKAREWVIENFSIKNTGPKIEEFIDSCPLIEEGSFPKFEKKDPLAKIKEEPDDHKWIKLLYKNILKVEVKDDDDGLSYWLGEMEKGTPRSAIENYFRQVANKENQEISKENLKNFLSKDDEGRRILFVIPHEVRDVFICTSLFKSLKEVYPKHNLYVATKKELFPLIFGNPYVKSFFEYHRFMDDAQALEGDEANESLFEIVFTPHLNRKNYAHNNKDKPLQKLIS